MIERIQEFTELASSQTMSTMKPILGAFIICKGGFFRMNNEHVFFNWVQKLPGHALHIPKFLFIESIIFGLTM